MERKVTLLVTAQKKNLLAGLREVDLGKEAVAVVVATTTETAHRVVKTKIEDLRSLAARTEAITEDLVMVTNVEKEEATLQVVTVKTELIATGDLEETEIEPEIENLEEIIEMAAPMEDNVIEGLMAVAVHRMVNPDQEPALTVEKKATSREIVHSLTSVKTVEAVIEEKEETMAVAEETREQQVEDRLEDQEIMQVVVHGRVRQVEAMNLLDGTMAGELLALTEDNPTGEPGRVLTECVKRVLLLA